MAREDTNSLITFVLVFPWISLSAALRSSFYICIISEFKHYEVLKYFTKKMEFKMNFFKKKLNRFYKVQPKCPIPITEKSGGGRSRLIHIQFFVIQDIPAGLIFPEQFFLPQAPQIFCIYEIRYKRYFPLLDFFSWIRSSSQLRLSSRNRWKWPVHKHFPDRRFFLWFLCGVIWLFF